MSLKAVLITLFATSTIANPTQLERREGGGKYLPEEEYEKALTRDPTLGWCTFHLHEDWVNAALEFFGQKSHKIEMHLFDASDPPALIKYLPQTEIKSSIPYTLPYDGLPGNLIVKKAPLSGEHIMEFEYNGETFKTDDTTHCSAGPYSHSNNREERDYDCGFIC